MAQYYKFVWCPMQRTIHQLQRILEERMVLKTLWVEPEVHMVYNAEWIKLPDGTQKWIREDRTQPSLDLYFQSGKLRVRHAPAKNELDITFTDVIAAPLETQP